MSYVTAGDVVRQPGILDGLDAFGLLLFTQEGVVGTRQALRHLSRATIRHRLASGRWRRVHRAVLVTHNGPLTHTQRLWIASLAAGSGAPALLGGRTALARLGLKGFAGDHVHVLLPAGSRHRDPLPGVMVHRTATLPAEHVLQMRPPCTSAARSVVDACAWARSDREAATVVAMAFQQRIVGLDDIGAVLGRMPRARRRQLTWLTATDAAGGAQSLGELDTVRLLHNAGLPAPTRQHERASADGRKRYLDLYWEDWGLHVEIDGAHHLDPRQSWMDADRQNQLWIAGDTVLRFPAWIVRTQPGRVAADIRRALVALGWRP